MEMPGLNSGRRLTLTDRRAATFVTLPASSRYFLPFLARDCSAAPVARELGVDPGAVAYRLRQMLGLGLIRRTRTAARAGRAVQHYRSIADEIFAPLELTPLDSLRALFDRGRQDSHDLLDASLEDAWLDIGHRSQWGTHLYRAVPTGPVNRDFVPATGATDFWAAVLDHNSPAVWDQHAQLRLTRADAKHLQRQLAALVTTYASRQTKTADTYLVRLALAARRTTPP